MTWLDLEQAESRYLLAGSADCSVAIYDVAQPVSNDHGKSISGDCASVLRITQATPGCHQFSVSSVCWYPVDNGVFVTGSFDNQVKVLNLHRKGFFVLLLHLPNQLAKRIPSVQDCRYGMPTWAK